MEEVNAGQDEFSVQEIKQLNMTMLSTTCRDMPLACEIALIPWILAHT